MWDSLHRAFSPLMLLLLFCLVFILFRTECTFLNGLTVLAHMARARASAMRFRIIFHRSGSLLLIVVHSPPRDEVGS